MRGRDGGKEGMYERMSCTRKSKAILCRCVCKHVHVQIYMYVYTFIVTCVGRSKTPPVPLPPLNVQ